jgi:pimeloyl-ACP methyl ester carboxylesterase
VIDADLVFIHGFWSSAATWDRLVARLREDESLAGLRVHLFEYESPKLPPLPSWRTRIPDYDDIAQSLPSFLEANMRNGAPLIIVTHSQGGLILQRFLAWMLTRGRGRELARISSIVMLSCPNEGSEYLASIRAALGMRRHPQASQLAVLGEDVRHSRQIVLSQIIYATQSDDYHCQIPVYTYSGRTDNVVLRQSAQSVFPYAGVLPGDHFSILDPDARGSLTQDTIRRHIVASLKPPDERRPGVGSPIGGEPGRPDVSQPPIRPDAYPVRESPNLPRDPWNIPPPVRAFIGRDAEI